MNGYQKRTQQKIDSIKKAAIELFNVYGLKKVSMDEIAVKADVSKVTIYKYFHSKEELIQEIVKTIFIQITDEIQEVIYSDMSFIEKLESLVFKKKHAASHIQGEFVEKVFSEEDEISQFLDDIYTERIQKLIYDFFDEGKKEGYIHSDIPNDILYQYIKIMRKGLSMQMDELKTVMTQPEVFKQLVHLFFYGLIK